MINKELVQDIKDLMAVALNKAETPIIAKFSEAGLSKDDVENTLREKLNSLYNPMDAYASPEGKNTCFALIAENVLAELPKKVAEQFGLFIEQKTVKAGDKPRFIVKTGRKALKKFVTRGSQSGIYRKGTLDKKELTFDYFTLVGGLRLEYREYSTGFLTMSELQEIILEQASYCVFSEVQTLLKSTYSSLPANNKHSATSFVEADMDKIIDTISTYGTPVIFCTEKFARTLPLVSAYDQKGISDIHTAGYVRDYKGTAVSILDNSFTDEDNTTKVIDDEYAYILPMGKEGVIKLYYEGQMRIREIEEVGTGAMTWQFAQNVGMSTVFTNNIGIYQNTAL